MIWGGVRRLITTWLNEDFSYRNGFELHYTSIPRKIIAEKYIENSDRDLFDYKFWCFDGKVEYIEFLSGRNTDGLKEAIYDTNWQKQDFIYHSVLDNKIAPRPANLDLMIKLAEKLSQGFIHVRVDFYDVNNRIYFGEMTFTPSSGADVWIPKEANLRVGQLINLKSPKKDQL